MANHLSALKRARQTEKRTATNRINTSRLRGVLREMRADSALFDFNHPLAGQPLQFEVKLISVL